ncbi:unnamed protein product [Triticum turgidum subsp. durum]|uniref:CASP-like protein n=1 Tax=Triticum turgidum subsp. durum TaxID=4567 RepID=A0A9R0SN51_TRITD|nr:unnamed protein product [Triticum turgidum subsp. durum]
MGFVSFAGRVLFASVFLLSAYQEFTEFGTDGGPAAKNLAPKFNSFTKNISVHLGVVVPHVELKHVVAATIGLKGLGGLLFIVSSSFGAYLLVCTDLLLCCIIFLVVIYAFTFISVHIAKIDFHI